MRSIASLALVLGVVVPMWAGLPAEQAAGVFQGEAVERFLTDGRIIAMKKDLQGVTGPRRATLELDGVSHDAVFKTVDFFRPGVTVFDDGEVEYNMLDQWQTEVAAYQIDRIIGLGMVPATVEREYEGERGSLQWWVESEMSEHQRLQDGVQPPDMEAFIMQGLKMQLFDSLIYNTDRHLRNILITKDFQVRLIDHSRSFRLFDEPMSPENLLGFSQSLLAGLERLERDDLRARIGKYVSNGQIDALLVRRDKLLALAKKMVAELGEYAVLYP